MSSTLTWTCLNDNAIALQGLSPPWPCDPLLLPPLPPRCLWQPPPPCHHRQQETLQGGNQHLRSQYGRHWVSSGLFKLQLKVFN